MGLLSTYRGRCSFVVGDYEGCSFEKRKNAQRAVVSGDHIIIRPGQVAPGQCTELNNRFTFQCGETYGMFQPTDPPLKPTARAPLPDLVCLMEVTPYLDTLKTSFESFLKRPATIYNQQRCLVRASDDSIKIPAISICFLRFS